LSFVERVLEVRYQL